MAREYSCAKRGWPWNTGGETGTSRYGSPRRDSHAAAMRRSLSTLCVAPIAACAANATRMQTSVRPHLCPFSSLVVFIVNHSLRSQSLQIRAPLGERGIGPGAPAYAIRSAAECLRTNFWCGDRRRASPPPRHPQPAIWIRAPSRRTSSPSGFHAFRQTARRHPAERFRPPGPQTPPKHNPTTAELLR